MVNLLAPLLWRAIVEWVGQNEEAREAILDAFVQWFNKSPKALVMDTETRIKFNRAELSRES